MEGPAATIELTPGQQRAVDHRGGALVLLGRARSGRTTAVAARWAHLVDAGADPARVLVLCRNAGAARVLRSALLARTSTGAAPLQVTSPSALAFDALARSEPGRTLAGTHRQRALVSQLLGELGTAELHRLSPAGMTDALVDELASLALAASPHTLPGALQRAGEQGCSDRWEVAATIVGSYHAALDAAGLVDRATLLERAAVHLATGDDRFDSLLIDDVDFGACGWGSPASMTEALLAPAADALVTTDPEQRLPAALSAATIAALDDPPIPGRREALACHHPSIEADAVAGVVLEQLAAGAEPGEIAVIARTPRRAAAVARALNRHGVTASPPPGTATLDAHVAGLAAMLRWVAGDEAARRDLLASPLSGLDADSRQRLALDPGPDHPGGADAADPVLAHLGAVRSRLVELAGRADVATVAQAAFTEMASHLVPEPADPPDAAATRALDAVVAWIDDLEAEVDHDPGLDLHTYLLGRSAEGVPSRRRSDIEGAVIIVTPDEARGRAWPTVIVCGMVEGEMPRVSADVHYLDRALLDTEPVPTPAARRAEALSGERRLFSDLVRRATARCVAVAPLEAGALMSRFLADWDCRAATLPEVAPLDLPLLAPTTNGLPLHPDRSLRLSASQLDTYSLCPRRYLYEYPLRVRGDANIWADFGTLVHDILEAFIGPNAEATDLSWERLVALAESHWRDDIAEYRPQREELRRDLMEVLEGWWEAEGGQIGTTLEVLAAERAFTIDVGSHTVTGRIDRVDRADDGTGVRILDYKTSKQAKSAADTEDDLQLRMYHLAALRDPEIAAFGLPSQLRLLFLRGMKARDQQITDDHESVTVELVEAIADRILDEDYEPIAGDHCRHCSVKRLCPLWPEGRESVAAP